MRSTEPYPNLRVVRDREHLASEAAEAFAAAALNAAATRGRFLAVLAGGSTPQAMFSLLATPPYAAKIPWQSTYLFWGDERLVPAGDPGSNYYHAKRLLLDHVPIPQSQLFPVRGELPATDALEDYEHKLRILASSGCDWPRFDLALMGLGADGHTASLFPQSPAITESKRAVVAVRAEYNNRPAQRITLTPPLFNDARQVLFLVAGTDKAAALKAVLSGQDGAQTWPAQIIQPHSGNLTWLVDVDAARMVSNP